MAGGAGPAGRSRPGAAARRRRVVGLRAGRRHRPGRPRRRYRRAAPLLVLDNCEHLARPAPSWPRRSCGPARDFASWPPAASRWGWRGKSPGACRRCRARPIRNLPPRRWSVRGGAPVRGAIAPGPARFHADRGERPPGGGDLRSVRWHPARPRAGRGAVRGLSIEELAAGLGDRFRLLTGGCRTAMPRQQTLEASVDWSYSLLDEDERALLRRLSAFAGGFLARGGRSGRSRRRGAGGIGPEQILALLSQLAEQSLIQADDEAEGRFGMLETVRHYAGLAFDPVERGGRAPGAAISSSSSRPPTAAPTRSAGRHTGRGCGPTTTSGRLSSTQRARATPGCCSAWRPVSESSGR